MNFCPMPANSQCMNSKFPLALAEGELGATVATTSVRWHPVWCGMSLTGCSLLFGAHSGNSRSSESWPRSRPWRPATAPTSSGANQDCQPNKSQMSNNLLVACAARVLVPTSARQVLPSLSNNLPFLPFVFLNVCPRSLHVRDSWDKTPNATHANEWCAAYSKPVPA